MAIELDIIKRLHGDSPVPYAVTDEDFSIVWANGCALKRYPQLSIPGGMGLLFSSAQLEAARQKSGAFSIPLAAVSHFAASFTPIDGGYLISIGFADVSDTYAMMPQSIDYITSAISNQLRYPLSNIFISASALSRQTEISENEHVRGLLEEINSSGYRMLRFITDFSAYLNHMLGEGKRAPEALDLAAHLRRLLSAAAIITESAGIPLEYNLPDEPVIVAADARSLELALLHLISNSCRFTCEDNRITVSLTCDDDNARITVSDNGLGIPPEVLPNICEPFFCYDHGGETALDCGLGLSIVRQAAAACGGSFAVTSLPDKGVTAALSLPLAKDLKSSGALRSPTPPPICCATDSLSYTSSSRAAAGIPRSERRF